MEQHPPGMNPDDSQYSGAAPDDRDPQLLGDMLQPALDAVERPELEREFRAAIEAHRALMRAHEQGIQVSDAELAAAEERLRIASQNLRDNQPLAE